MSNEFVDERWKRNLRRRLLAWFDRHARELPWRVSRDPYRIWVSEIMLQQTQVATVKPYFERFVETFPTLESLATAPEEQVLRLWEGLGYYRRARQLHRAARMIVDEFSGRFPSASDELQSLPGIGRYTAGAILSIAFDRRAPIVEANTLRLYSRLLCHRGDTSSSDSLREFWKFAEEILPQTRCGAFNQALMELGATICTPRDPQCDNCPVRTLCPTRARGLQAKIPAPSRATRWEESREACVVVWRRKRVLLRRCAEGERWAGLWDFPRFPVEAAKELNGELAIGVERLTGMRIESCKRLTTIRHGVTRFRITLECYQADWRQGRLGTTELAWVSPADLGEYPLSKTARRISQLIAS